MNNANAAAASSFDAMLETFRNSAATVAAFDEAGFVIVGDKSATLTLGTKRGNGYSFDFSILPTVYPRRASANGIAADWNRQHGAAHRVVVMTVAEWKAARAIEFAESIGHIENAIATERAA